MRTQLTPETALSVGGAVAVVVGGYLPWFQVDPRFDPLTARFPEVYGALSDTGIHGIDLVLFGVVGAALVFQFLDIDQRIRSLVTGLGGTGIALYCLYYPVVASRIGFGDPIAPVLGWYLTLLGGLLLGASGLYRVAGDQTA